MDEAQDDRPPAVAGQAVDGAPGRGGRLAPDDGLPRRRPGRRLGGELERGLRSAAPAAPALGDDVAGDPEQPDPERGRLGPSSGRARSSNRAGRPGRTGTSAPWRPPPRGGRRARRPRSCTPGPGTSDTGRRTVPGRSAPPPRAADRGRGGRGADDRPPPVVPLSSMPVGPSRYTPAAVGGLRIREPDVPDLADEHRALAARRARSSTTRRAGRGVDAEGRGPWSRRRPARSSSTSRPVVTWRSAQSRASNRPSRSASTRGSSRREEGVEQRVVVDPAAADASRSDVIEPASSGGKSSAAQSALMPMPTTARGSSVPRPSVSPSTPASLRTAPSVARRRGRSAT